VGLAVRVNARDLGYALSDEIDRLRESGELAKIFERHGVTLQTPIRAE
jgi:adenylylsulfate kinase-like enzyme